MGENFCCCCSLRAGTFFYGGCLFLLSIFGLLHNFTVIAYYPNDGLKFQIIGTLINMVFLVLLLYGTIKGKKIFVLIFLVWDAVVLVLLWIIVFILGIYVAPEMFIGLLIIAIFAYLWYNVFCFFNHLSAKERHEDRDVEGRMFDEQPENENK